MLPDGVGTDASVSATGRLRYNFFFTRLSLLVAKTKCSLFIARRYPAKDALYSFNSAVVAYTHRTPLVAEYASYAFTSYFKHYDDVFLFFFAFQELKEYDAYNDGQGVNYKKYLMLLLREADEAFPPPPDGGKRS